MNKILLVGACLGLLFACQTTTTPVPPLPPPPILTALPAMALPLADLSRFDSPAANWQIVGTVSAPMDKSVEQMPHAPGTGILLNSPSDAAQGPLSSNFEHGDLELSFEFMMPKGSNSGIYLMGRYEIQLLDSWGKKEIGPGDCGGIYERWDDTQPEGQKGYEGHTPSLNAARAPGLWQSMKIRFRAPRFDQGGMKTENALVEGVWFNGYQIHENVSLSGPTRGSFFPEESDKGPIIIQGDHGPIAFRHFQYKAYEQKSVSLGQMEYQYFRIAAPTNILDSLDFYSLDTLTAELSGKTDTLSPHLSPERDRFILHFMGTMRVPDSGAYFFRGRVGGGYKLTIDGEEVLRADGERGFFSEVAYGQTVLSAGSHTFTLTYLQNHRWWRRGLGLWVEGPSMDFQPLHTYQAIPHPGPTQPMWVQADQRPKLHRSFVMHQNEKLTHAISVGSPMGVHFNYELRAAKVLNLWKGRFLDAEPMWRGRGESQLSEPGGPVQELVGWPGIVPARYTAAQWPTALAENTLDYQGYILDAEGYPSFLYQLGELMIQDSWQPLEAGQGWRRTLTGKGNGTARILLDHTSQLTLVSEGLYLMNEGAYYLRLPTENQDAAEVWEGKNQANLTALLTAGSTISYEWIW